MWPNPLSAAGRRSTIYQRIHRDPAIHRATHFFAAAAEVTRVLGWSRRSAFFDDLGARLEVVNLERAREILAGARYSRGSVDENTVDFVRFEQRLVQQELDVLRRADPRHHECVVNEANGKIARAGGVLVRLSHPLFARAVANVVAHLQRPMDFALRADRELLGATLARQGLSMDRRAGVIPLSTP